MLDADDRPALLTDVDAELEQRWPWWAWVPDVERRLLIDALVNDDAETVEFLTKIGERRGRYRRWETCIAVQEIRAASGEAVLDENDVPVVIRFAPVECASGFACMSLALANDALNEYLDAGSGLGAGAALSFAAHQLHRDSEWSIERWLKAKKRGELLNAVEQFEPPAEPPTEDELLTAVKSSAPPPSTKENGNVPIRHSRRWYDGDRGIFHRVF